MTNPMENAYQAIMDTYNPLDVKDIISCGAARQAKYHKTRDEILSFYAEHNEGMHHELLDANEDVFKAYAFMQKYPLLTSSMIFQHITFLCNFLIIC